MEPVQNMCCPPLLRCFSARLLLQLAGLPNWQSRAEYVICRSLSLTPCPNPPRTPALSLPSGGLNFSWLDGREVGRASSCFGWLFASSIKPPLSPSESRCHILVVFFDYVWTAVIGAVQGSGKLF